MHSWIVPASIAVLVWGVWGFLPKLAVKYMNPWTVTVFQGCGTLLVTIGILVYQWKTLSFHHIGAMLAIAGGVCGLGGTLFFVRALSLGDTNVVVPFTALYPLVTVILSTAILKEPLTAAHILGLILALVAVALLST
jgi:transporter family protein